MSVPPKVALVYDASAYEEKLRSSDGRGGPTGLMGRQVAGHQFLDAYLTHGSWDQLTAIVTEGTDPQPLIATCKSHPSSRDRERRLRCINARDFSSSFCEDQVAAPQVYFPCPPDVRYAWARHQAAQPHPFAISGVTHTLSSLRSVEALRNLVTGPYRSYDRLICTSRAVRDMVSAVVSTYSDHLGIKSVPEIGFETIPLGVNPEKFVPPSNDQRQQVRCELGIEDDELVVLFVGRLSHHAKSHPFPMYRSVEAAANNTGRRVHLLLAGWAANAGLLQGFKESATKFAPSIRTTIVDGTDPQKRYAVWQAADIFTSLSDNIQETFGLVILEAMSSGLPVVASDWNGYRDLVADQETGFLVPTCMVRDATSEATLRLLTNVINYDHFLAECNQTVTVDCSSATMAFSKLLEDVELRKRMGEAGRRRVQQHFGWGQVITAYEQLWFEQERQRRAESEEHAAQRTRARGGLPVYPSPEQSFASYPTMWLSDLQEVRCGPDAVNQLKNIADLPMTNYESHRRCHDLQTLQQALALAATGCKVVDLDALFREAGTTYTQGRATVAWLLKYDLLKVAKIGGPKQLADGNSEPVEHARLTFVTTCMGRLEFLKDSIATMVAQPECKTIVVDYSCPDNAGDWVEENYPTARVVRCPGQSHFHRSAAKNAGAFMATTPWICLIDADIVLSPEFSQRVLPQLRNGECYRASVLGEGTGGTIICTRDDFHAVRGHDLNFQGWGEEDDDLRDALKFSGLNERCYPVSLIQHVDHDDEARLKFHDATSREESHMVNRMYRAVKWDMARLMKQPLTPERCTELYEYVGRQVSSTLKSRSTLSLEFDVGQMTWAPVEFGCSRKLRYELAPTSQA